VKSWARTALSRTRPCIGRLTCTTVKLRGIWTKPKPMMSCKSTGTEKAATSPTQTRQSNAVSRARADAKSYPTQNGTWATSWNRGPARNATYIESPCNSVLSRQTRRLWRAVSGSWRVRRRRSRRWRGNCWKRGICHSCRTTPKSAKRTFRPMRLTKERSHRSLQTPQGANT